MAKHTHRNKRNNIKKRLNKRNTLKKSNTIKRKKSLEIKNKSKKKTQRGGIEERMYQKDESAKRKLIANITQGHTFYIHCPREESNYYSEFFKNEDDFNNDFNRRKCITKMVKDSYNHQYRFFATKKPTTKFTTKLSKLLPRKNSQRMMQFVYTKNNDNEYDCFLITYKKDENYDYTSYREDEMGLNEMENREMEEPMRYPYDIHDVLQVYLEKKDNRNITYKTLNNSNEMLREDPLLVIEKLKKIKHEKHRNIEIQLNGDNNSLNITMSDDEFGITNRHEWNIGNKMKKGKKMEEVEACFWKRKEKFEEETHPYYWGGKPCYYKEPSYEKVQRRLPFTNIYSSTLLKFLPEFHYRGEQWDQRRPDYFKFGDNYELLQNTEKVVKEKVVVNKKEINDTNYFDLAFCLKGVWMSKSMKIYDSPSPIYTLNKQNENMYSIHSFDQKVIITNPMIQLLEDLLGNSLIHEYKDGIKIIYNSTNLEISAVRATTTEK